MAGCCRGVRGCWWGGGAGGMRVGAPVRIVCGSCVGARAGGGGGGGGAGGGGRRRRGARGL